MTEQINQNKDLIKYMRMISQQNKLRMIILRGCITGIFTSVGTLVGLALIVFVGANLLGGLRQIPLLDVILEQTKLDVLIENQVDRLTDQPSQNTDGGTDGSNTDGGQEIQDLNYNNASLGISFVYPSTFDSVNLRDGELDSSNKVIELTGKGTLISLEVYANHRPTLVGNNSQRFISMPDGSRVTMNVYEQGVLINGEQFNNVVYQAELTNPSGSFYFVGVADSEFPKTAREVFTQIVESTTTDQ